jgi:hypothetical protein
MGLGSDSLQYLIEAMMCLHEFNQIQAVARNRLMIVPHQQNELSSIRQLRGGFSQLPDRHIGNKLVRWESAPIVQAEPEY